MCVYCSRTVLRKHVQYLTNTGTQNWLSSLPYVCPHIMRLLGPAFCAAACTVLCCSLRCTGVSVRARVCVRTWHVCVCARVCVCVCACNSCVASCMCTTGCDVSCTVHAHTSSLQAPVGCVACCATPQYTQYALTVSCTSVLLLSECVCLGRRYGNCAAGCAVYYCAWRALCALWWCVLWCECILCVLWCRLRF